jgi:Uma2 family endonuclease
LQEQFTWQLYSNKLLDLTAPELLPEFELQVSEIFAGLKTKVAQ